MAKSTYSTWHVLYMSVSAVCSGVNPNVSKSFQFSPTPPRTENIGLRIRNRIAHGIVNMLNDHVFKLVMMYMYMHVNVCKATVRL